MKATIVLYDENNERVGETFPRRAKQLIKSGRAYWLEEGQTLRMALPPPRKEEITMETMYSNNGAPVAPPHHEPPNELLMYLAKQNIKERRNLVRHVIAYVLVWAIIITANVFHTSTRNFFTTTSSEAPEIEASTMHRGSWAFEDWDLERYRVVLEMPDIPAVFITPHEIQAWAQTPIVRNYEIFQFNNTPPQQVLTGMHTTTVIYTSNFNWAFAVGAMTVWGIVIISRSIKLLHRRRQMLAKTPRPDPVEMEYQRLCAMS